MHKFLGPVLEKVHFDPQVGQLRDGFNVVCEIAFRPEKGFPSGRGAKTVLGRESCIDNYVNKGLIIKHSNYKQIN